MRPLDQVRADVIHMSGSGKKLAPNARRHGIYTSFTLPGLDDLEAVRDTRQRFDDWDVPADLTDRTLIDVGSNVGAVALEAARRGATVTGVEYREDRVALANEIATGYELSALFYRADLNALVGGEEWRRPYDYVVCSSVDEYVDDLEGFYALLRYLCAGTLYHECNRQGGVSVEETEIYLRRAGFAEVKYLGNGHSGGIARKRKLFRARVNCLPF